MSQTNDFKEENSVSSYVADVTSIAQTDGLGRERSKSKGATTLVLPVSAYGT